MIIKPLSDRKLSNKRWAVITRAGLGGLELCDSNGRVYRRRRGFYARKALMEIDGLVFAIVPLSHVLLATDARYWEGRTWHNALAGLRMDGGPKVLSMRKIFDDVPPGDALTAIALFSDQLREFRVPFGSLSRMAWGLWRRSLSNPVTIQGPGIRDALHGGRKECRFPGEYQSVAYWDVSAAYPRAQVAEEYPLRLRRVAPSSSMTDGMGIAFAAVTIPRLPWGPLPVRVAAKATCYGWGDAEGWWTWRDLTLAREAGCKVNVYDSWAGFHTGRLFDAWWQMCAPLRSLPGAAGRLGKAVTSTLWGQFALSEDETARVRWLDQWGRRRISVPEPKRELPHRWIVHIAGETTARVREKLWQEGLQAVPDAIYCDTDSIMCGDGVPHGTDWAQKKTMVRVDIRGPQVYRYTCPTCPSSSQLHQPDHPDWHYVVGGVASASGAERVFRRDASRHYMELGLGVDGLAVPQMWLEKARELVGQARTRHPAGG